ncbi:MAG: hypothetical protein E7355_04590 [Clostridiales bacterium]|nr:hypothetical protein [Clostridiales bacterium]
MAYNNGVEEITITQNGFDGRYMSYLYGRVKERFSFLPSSCNLFSDGERVEIEFKTEKAYCPYVRKFAEENIADVIAVGYKYAFFEKRLTLPLLDEKQKRLLITAIVAADYKEDKAYARRRFVGYDKYSLDGVYHFRLQDLQKRWEGIADYVPTDMGAASLDGFLSFLTEDGEGKIFVKNGKVYDEDYRLLTRALLTGRETTLGEIVLGGAERVYCFGETDKETAAFLRKYYGNKATFC